MPNERIGHRGVTKRLTAGVALVALIAAGCGSAGDDSDDAAPEIGAAESDVLIEAGGDPVPGGRLSYGLEADTDGLLSHRNRWAISGIMLAQAVYDPLTALDVDGDPQPYLAESFEPNDAFDVWTITMRDGVQFHDGEPLTAEAVALTLEAHRRSGLTSSAVVPIEEIEVTGDLTLEVRMQYPWVAFPSAMTSQVGFVLSPKMAPAPQDDTDEAIAAAIEAAEVYTRDPIGTGPFEQAGDWTGGNWVGARNENYWRDGLPYLEELEFRTITDPQTRRTALASGELQMMHTSDPDTIVELRRLAGNEEIQLAEDRGESEESFVLLNTESEGPIGDVRVRRALALATDRVDYNDTVNAGVTEVASGPFKADSPWYVETDYPDYNLEEATALIADYQAETGNAVAFTLSTTPGPATERSVALLQQMWEEAGAVVNVETIDQTEFISTAIFGTYEANLWRQFGAIDPDVDLVWWAGFLAEDADGQPVENPLNFARNRNPAIDEALQQGRTSIDSDDRVEAYQEFQRLLAEDMPYIWLHHSLWAVAAGNDVRGITNGTLPDGTESIPLGGNGTFGGTHRLTQTWLER